MKGGESFMNPKQFLTIGGIVLILVGVLGAIGVIGPTADQSLFGAAWWFDTAENWAHLVIGVVGLVSAFILPAATQKGLTMIVGVVAVLAGIYSLFYPTLLGANLENPTDTILHLVVGVWGIWSSRKG